MQLARKFGLLAASSLVGLGLLEGGLRLWLTHAPPALYMSRPGNAGRVALPLPRATVARDSKLGTGYLTPPFEDTINHSESFVIFEVTKAKSD